MSKVEVDAVCCVELLYEFRQIRTRRLQDKVIVVAHQREGVEPYVVLVYVLLEGGQESLPIPVIPVDVAPVVAPRGNVIDGARELHT